MSDDRFPVPPIDRDEIERAHALLRRKLREAPPAADQLTREMQENIANGIRGRDLLDIPAYRDHLTAHADVIAQRLRQVREELDEQNRHEREDE
jgi:hypothetical protein